MEPSRADLDGVSERAICDLMWQKVGLFRDGPGLTEAVETLEAWDAQLHGGGQSTELGMMVTSARLVARAALRRTESRGAHYRSDYPDRNDIDWSRHMTNSRL